MTRILIVSGFLGAGKTTFIRELVKHAPEDIVILENEYASVNVDRDILRGEAGLNVWEMTERCICCTGRSDFASSVLTIVNTLEPEVLVVEPTGIGFLSKVAELISKIEYERITLLAPVTVIDPVSFDSYHLSYGELFDDQIRSAGKILLSKTDTGTDREIIRETSEKIRKIRSDADIIKTDYRMQPDPFWQDILCTKMDGSRQTASDIPDMSCFESLTVQNAETGSAGQLVMLMEDIVRGRFGRVIRAKGTVLAGGELLRIDISDMKYSITGAEPDSLRDCVFIGETIDRSGLNKELLPGYVNDIIGSGPIRPYSKRGVK